MGTLKKTTPTLTPTLTLTRTLTFLEQAMGTLKKTIPTLTPTLTLTLTFLEQAMGTLKKTINEEKVAIRSQLAEMEGRLAAARDGIDKLAEAKSRVEGNAPEQCKALCAKGHAYVEKGMTKCDR